MTREPLCAACFEAVTPLETPRCRRCGEFLDPLARGVELCALCRRRRRDPLAAARAALPYDGLARRLIVRLKYQRRRRAAAALGAILREWLRVDQMAANVLGLPDAAALVPVPLHWWRRSLRGYNQARLLADELAEYVGLPVCEALVRTRATRPQVGLGHRERRRNVAGAFAVEAGVVGRGAGLVLVDDVFTTGATLRECARVLRRAGAGVVTALTVARATHADLPAGPLEGLAAEGELEEW